MPSLHEVPAGGCLRVVHEQDVPVHRHPASTQPSAPMRPAVVLAVDGDGPATSVMTVAATVWIRTDLLTVAARGEPPCTGDRLSLADEVIVDEGGRRLMVAGTALRTGGLSTAADGCWVLRVTDTRPRGNRQRDTSLPG